MFYYEVWVRSEHYRGAKPLTYKYTGKLLPGALVRVPLRAAMVDGFVSAKVPKPPFTVKAIDMAYQVHELPKACLQLADWLLRFYPSPIGVISGLFMPKRISTNSDRAHIDKESSLTPAPLPPLTDQQAAALERMRRPDTYLLHGRTGSGKTRVYLELTQQALAAGRSALILCPEIGLTSQLAQAFRERFGACVIVLHSQLSTKEREAAWLAILEARAPIIAIGPRSALFSPAHNVGLIVIDEFHDQAYKQEQPPYYQTVRVASQLRIIHNATLVLGSATPAIADYFMAKQRKKPILRLDAKARPQAHESQLTIVDLKDHAKFTRSRHLSAPLLSAITDSLKRHEQALLYLNRRGTARVTLCEHCGWQALCTHCDLPLTYHGDSFTLRCHICGQTTSTPRSCPSCGNPAIAFHSFGTKAIVEEVQALFPEARILRLDTDTRKAERLENQYQSIVSGDVDILVGTQLLTKGLDLPRLSTLGIILADSSLYLPDFTAEERTYQLLNQVIGRVNRGHIASHTIVQTYQPASPLLQAAISDDWESFYASQIQERSRYAYPPFCHLLKLTCTRASAKSAERAVTAFKEVLLQQGIPVVIDGPAPAFHERAGTKYKWQLVIKARDRSLLQHVISLLPTGWSYDIDPQDLL